MWNTYRNSKCYASFPGYATLECTTEFYIVHVNIFLSMILSYNVLRPLDIVVTEINKWFYCRNTNDYKGLDKTSPLPIVGVHFSNSGP